MNLSYERNDLAGWIAVTLIRDAFNSINAIYGTKFHTYRGTGIPRRDYVAVQRARVMPLYVSNWYAGRLSDTDDFARTFMHSEGALSQSQGYLGVTSFPNALVDSYIDAGIATTVPSERQGNYTWLQQYYVDNALGFVISQPNERSQGQRDWVEGSYYNPLAQGNYIYDLWKEILMTPVGVDVAVTGFVCPTEIHITDITVDDTIIMVPSPITVTVTRLDTADLPSIVVIIGVGLQDESGRDIVLDTDSATLTNTGSDSYTTYFYNFTQDAGAPMWPGNYTAFATVLVQSGYAQDTNAANDRVDQAPISINYGDCNFDNTCDMADISLCIDAFMSTPIQPNWDVRCDIDNDNSVDMVDISICICLFMTVYPFP
jgi:hypothetical protein